MEDAEWKFPERVGGVIWVSFARSTQELEPRVVNLRHVLSLAFARTCT